MSLSPGRSVNGPDDCQVFVGGDLPMDQVGTPGARQVNAANHSKSFRIARQRQGGGVGLETWGMQVKGVTSLDSCPE